ncbi:uncharacterized protein LOC120340472 isoform X1 [Styela clava]
MYDESTYILLVPPNPGAKQKRFETMAMSDFMECMASIGKTTSTQGTQVTFQDRICNLGIMNCETQTVKIERNNKSTGVDHPSKTDFSCNTEIAKRDMATMTLETNTIFGKRSHVVLPMQRCSTSFSEVPNPETKFKQQQKEIQDWASNKKAENKRDMKFLECHLKKLQVYMQNIAGENSELISFGSRYVNHILDTTKRLSTEDKAKVMEQDKVIMAKNFETDPLWSLTNVCPVGGEDQKATVLVNRNTSEEIYKELKETSLKRSREIPTEASRNGNNNNDSGIVSKRMRFKENKCGSQSPEMVVLSTADITPENSPLKTQQNSRKSSDTYSIPRVIGGHVSRPVSHSDAPRRRFSCNTPVTPSENTLGSIRNGNSRPVADGRPHTPTEPYPAYLSSSNTYKNNTSRGQITTNKYPINIKLQNPNLNRSADPQGTCNMSNNSHAPPKPTGLQNLRDPRLRSRAKRASQEEEQATKLKQWDQNRPKSQTSKQEHAKRERSKSSNLENVSAGKYERTPPMPKTAQIRNRGDLTSQKKTMQSKGWQVPENQPQYKSQTYKYNTNHLENQPQYKSQTYSNRQYVQNMQPRMKSTVHRQSYHPSLNEHNNDIHHIRFTKERREGYDRNQFLDDEYTM